MRLPLLLLASLLTVPVLAQHTAPDDPEAPAIRAAIGHYFEGHATGDGAHFEQAFHPVANLYWVRDGALQQRTGKAYIAGTPGTPPADEADRKRRIDWIDRTGDAAVVKVVLDYPRATFVDYMSMLKVDGTWRIVNKTFQILPASSP